MNLTDVVRGPLNRAATKAEVRSLARAVIEHIVDALRDRPTITIVATVGDLPASAGPREWFRVVGDPFIYVGNGQGAPLRKIPTQAL